MYVYIYKDIRRVYYSNIVLYIYIYITNVGTKSLEGKDKINTSILHAHDHAELGTLMLSINVGIFLE